MSAPPSDAATMLEQSQWDSFWVPPDVQVTDREDLLLLGCDRPVSYLNTVLRARGELPERLAEVLRLQGARHTRWMVTDTRDPAPVEALLDRAGWRPGPLHEVRSLGLERWRHTRTQSTCPVLSEHRLRQAVTVGALAFGGTPHFDEVSLGLDLKICQEQQRVFRYVVEVDGEPAGTAGLTSFPKLGFGLLWGGGVLPQFRGRGAYSALLDARVEQARHLGLRRVGLYALHNTSAPIVARFGFEKSGIMRFYERP